MSEPKTRTETFRVQGGQLLDRVKQLIHEGNVRHIKIMQGGRTVVEFPLTVGVVGVVVAPVLAAVGALAALLTDCTIEVERVEGPREAGEPEAEGTTTQAQPSTEPSEPDRPVFGGGTGGAPD